MYEKLIQVKTPRIFFKHELDELTDSKLRGVGYREGYIPKYFTFVDKNNKLTDKVLYVPYDLNEKNRWGDTICVMKRCEEERYSQHIIDSCKEHYKKTGYKQYEWHLVKKPAVINVISGECVFIAKDEMDYVYVYDNLIYYSPHLGSDKKIFDRHGMLLADNVSEILNTKTHLIAKINHDYRTDIDTVVCINKLTGNIDNKF